jgi:hypothetical protein
VSDRRSGSARIRAAVMAPWLVRWMLLQDRHHVYIPPGFDKPNQVHVVCPEDGCDNEDWVTLYEPGSVTRCNRHRPRKAMVPCTVCGPKPRYRRG